jgi:hypothetical protein
VAASTGGNAGNSDAYGPYAIGADLSVQVDPEGWSNSGNTGAKFIGRLPMDTCGGERGGELAGLCRVELEAEEAVESLRLVAATISISDTPEDALVLV